MTGMGPHLLKSKRVRNVGRRLCGRGKALTVHRPGYPPRYLTGRREKRYYHCSETALFEAKGRGWAKMDARGQLFRTKYPYDIPATDSIFLAAMRENAAFHIAHCPEYRRICRQESFAPEQLREIEDIRRIPPIPTLYFKRHPLWSIPKGRLPIQATSSGTAGRRSEIGFDWGGLFCGFHMVWHTAGYRGLFSPIPANYIVLGYRPTKKTQMAVAKTAFGSTLFAPAIRRTYALKERDGGYQVDMEGILRALDRCGKSPFPTRFMAFPAYTLLLLREMEKRGLHLKLPARSRYFLGGGWKQFFAERVEKEALYGLIEDRLGIPRENCVEFFGAVEHPILYCDCPQHHFHVPVYSRVLIRDVDTLEPLPEGRPGLVNLLTPMMNGMPLLSILTDDLGILHSGESCSCGIPSPWLELLGRVGVADIKTCAAGAEDILRGESP